MGYLIFCYLVIGFYFVVFMMGTSYDMLKREPLFNNIIFTLSIWLFWPVIIYIFKSKL